MAKRPGATSGSSTKGKTPDPGAVGDWRSRLNDALRSRQISDRAASLAAGMANTTVRHILVKDVSPALETIERICTANSLDLQEILFGENIGLPDNVHRIPCIRHSDVVQLIRHPDGFVAALRDIEPHGHRYVTTPSGQGDKAYALTMDTTAMEPTIARHDLLMIDANLKPKPDDIVAAIAQHNEEFWVRRVVTRQPGEILLRCDNPSWQVPEATAHVVGVVFAVERTFRTSSG